jgi:hypothetical protein
LGNGSAGTQKKDGSVSVGLPFTLRVAQERTRREVWSELHFRPVHLQITAVWAVTFTLDTILAILAHHRSKFGTLAGERPSMT